MFLGFDTDKLLYLSSLKDKNCEEELLDVIKAIYDIDDNLYPIEELRHEWVRIRAKSIADQLDYMED